MVGRASMVAVLLSLAVPAIAFGDTGKTVTAMGTGRAPVMPADRNSDASIRAAIDAARKQAIPAAVADAQDHATAYAAAAGLKLGPVQSVSDATSLLSVGLPAFDLPTDGQTPFIPPFGPGGVGNFCGTVRQPVFGGPRHHRKPIRVVAHRVCFVPRNAIASLTVTYTAT